MSFPQRYWPKWAEMHGLYADNKCMRHLTKWGKIDNLCARASCVTVILSVSCFGLYANRPKHHSCKMQHGDTYFLSRVYSICVNVMAHSLSHSLLPVPAFNVDSLHMNRSNNTRLNLFPVLNSLLKSHIGGMFGQQTSLCELLNTTKSHSISTSCIERISMPAPVHSNHIPKYVYPP